MPRFSLQGDVWRQYIASRSWLAGLGADLGGALLMIAAFALAPVRSRGTPRDARAPVLTRQDKVYTDLLVCMSASRHYTVSLAHQQRKGKQHLTCLTPHPPQRKYT